MATKTTAKDPAVKFWKREPGWDKLTRADEKSLEKYCRDYIAFLSTAKTERLACQKVLQLAEGAGYRDLDQVNAQGEKLQPGDCVYRVIDGKTILLAKVGTEALEKGLNLVGAHIDCPRLDLKPCPIYQDQDFVLLDTHYYGGIKKYQWVTMPLALYGVIIRRDGTKVEVAIGDKPEDPVFTITDLLPHLDIDRQSKPMRDAIPGEKLNVIFGSRPAEKKGDNKKSSELIKTNILRLLYDQYGVEEEDFASAELEVVPAGPARELGLDRSMILGYGHDDRVCAYAGARAILDHQGIPKRTMAVLLCDKEEIGSYGRTGMDSMFLPNTIAELLEATSPQGYNGLKLRRALENSRMLSADVGTLRDPDFTNVNSPNNHGCINCGIEIEKYDGSRGKSGSSDASAEMVAEVRKVFNDAGVIWQMAELGKVDVGGGGTIAMYMARHGIHVLDCGVGLLCMHAPWEIAGKLDVYMAYRGYGAFLANMG